MIKVITYGTFDMLHYGHINLLQRAKELGDYLIVGVTSEDFDMARGKINVKQTLMERVEAIKDTGLADEIIIEEYEGQKIDDIRRFGIDIFTVGSDWKGTFDYLGEYCKVIYLERTEGISSSAIREEGYKLRFGLIGNTEVVVKYAKESEYINGIEISGVCSKLPCVVEELNNDYGIKCYDYEELLEISDALYIISPPETHYELMEVALKKGKHILCESPIALSVEEVCRLNQIAKENNVILMESLKTAYSIAYSRLLLLLKGGRIGDIVSVDATCTSISMNNQSGWNSICSWGPTALLPVFQLLGTEYRNKRIVSHIINENVDSFTKISFEYDHAVASIKVGKGIKSEGELIISGTKGYIYVPAPWWKTDYFEIRYENPAENKKYFYQLDGEGIRYELVSFLRAIKNNFLISNIEEKVTLGIAKIVEDFYHRVDCYEI